jgi:dTDP-4-dehydrorhamnose reductase
LNVLILGANGQLGQSLRDTAPANINLLMADIAEIDIGATDQLGSALNDFAADAIINAAAYTAVDKAETEAELAQRINAEAVGILAEYCYERDLPLLHVSTDFVFSGDTTTPYKTDAPTGPLSVYGKTKLTGEQALQAANPDAYVVRSSWIYSEHGNNFVKTMLRLAATGKPLSIIHDQTGSPTYARNLAQGLWQLLAIKPAQKLLHFTDGGLTSWHDFAVAIFDESVRIGLITKMPDISPVTTADYPTPAQRPAFSGLDCRETYASLNLTQVAWRDALCDMLARLEQG